MASPPRSRSQWSDPLRVLAVALATLIVAPLGHGSDRPAAAAAARELLVQIEVNGQSAGAATIGVTPEGRVLLPMADFRRLRLKPAPAGANVDFEGESAVALFEVPLLRARLDERTSTLSLTAPPEAFELSEIEAAQRLAPALSPTAPGGFLNYDFAVERSTGVTRYGGVLEGVVFGNFGVGVASAVGRNDGTTSEIVRLETAYVKDFPQSTATLRLGDSIGVPGAWGRSVRFGGVQYGTNFATQPYLVRFPLQSVTGEAVLPSTVELLVNGVPTSTQTVPPGPFRITDVPTITGAGEIRVVVRDVLGREQVSVLPYYTPQTLLREGLNDYSIEGGAVRRNFGIESNDYGRWFGAGTFRRGITNTFTAEVRGEGAGSGDGASSFASGGVGAAYQVGDFGVASAAIAASTSDDGTGALYSLGFFRQGRVVSFGAQTTMATRDFTQLGLQENRLAPRNVSLASIGVNTGRTGTVAFGYGLLDERDAARRETYTLSYSLSFGRWGSFFATASETRSEGASTRGVFLTYTVALDRLTSAAVSWNRPGGGADPELVGTLQRSPPLGEGFGYILQATDNGRGYANGSVKTRYLDAYAEARYADSETAYRAGVLGSIVSLGRSVYATRPVTSSFAVVEVPDFPNVRVYQDNQLIGRTSDAGSILLPTLRPYERNPVRIDQRDLPLGARVDALEVQAVPAFRSGVLVRFPVGRSYGAVMKVLRADGTPPPAGAAAQIEGVDKVFPVAPDGELYLTGISAAVRVVVRWPTGACEFALPAIQGDDPLPDLGVQRCREVMQ
jgi:outer membrane usher protein